MKKWIKITGLVASMQLLGIGAGAQVSAPNANPSISSIVLQGPTDPGPQGSTINGTAVMRIRVGNSGADGTIPAGALDYQLSFNSYYTYASLITASSPGFAVTLNNNGAPDYTVHLTNTVPQPAGYGGFIYINVFATTATAVPAAMSAYININTTPQGIPLVGDANAQDSGLPKSFSTSNPSPLPIKLIDFTAKKTDDRRVQLNWQTSMEQNTDYFDVERSANGKDFNDVVRRMVAAGNSNAKTEYQTYDVNPIDGANFYRLKMMGKDGEYVYSGVRKVDFSSVMPYSVSPNPATDFIAIKGLEKDALVRISNATGTVVYENSAMFGTEEVDLSKFSAGNYFVQIFMNGELRFTTKLVKK